MTDTTTSQTTSHVTETPATDPKIAAAHFAGLLALETDCWDVRESMKNGSADFVLIQSNGTSESFAQRHIPGAVHLPHTEMTAESLAPYPTDTVFVVYCNGPHCNGADKGALKLALLGRPVKKMIGGIEGWIDEGFDLVSF